MRFASKGIIVAAFICLLGAAIYEARNAAILKSELRILDQKYAQLLAETDRLKNDSASAQPRGAVTSSAKKEDEQTSELLRLRSEVGMLRRQAGAISTTPQPSTNRLQFAFPYLPRESWSDQGAGKPLSTIATMFWAIGRGDQARLKELAARGRNAPLLDDITLPREDWERMTAVQVVSVTETRGVAPDGVMEYLATVETLVEKDVPEANAKDLNIHRWTLIKTDGQWLIMALH